MTVLGHLRRSQRLFRSIFAVFVLAWLQTALLPCVMAAPLKLQESHTQAMDAAAAMADMPDCVYCPSEQAVDAAEVADPCLYPDAPQVDGGKTQQLQSQQLLFHAVFLGSHFNPELELHTAAPPPRYLQPPILRRPLALTYCVQLK